MRVLVCGGLGFAVDSPDISRPLPGLRQNYGRISHVARTRCQWAVGVRSASSVVR